MFNGIKKLFTGGAKAPQQSAPEYLFTEAEAQALKIANGAVSAQLMLTAEGRAAGKISNIEHVTPWTVGYMIGVLDYATRITSTAQYARFETASLFLDIVFDKDNKEISQRAAALLMTCQHAMHTGEDPFLHGKHYVEGGKAGYETLPRTEDEPPKLALWHALKNGGYPPE